MTIPDDLHILIEGIVGSTAYGMARPDSDRDQRGVFAWPTEALFGLGTPRENYVAKTPDRALDEAGKFAGLALKGNPTVMELLWLPDDLYLTRTSLGDELIGIRSAFLSGPAVTSAYCGYARQQFHELSKHDSFGADLRRRTEKHARHLARLMHCGLHLLATGELQVRLEDPERFLQFGADVADTVQSGRSLDWVKAWVDGMSARFDLEQDLSPLPQQPDRNVVTDWLKKVRDTFLAQPSKPVGGH